MALNGIVETVKIVNPNDENDYIIINKEDYDEEKHTLWEWKEISDNAKEIIEPKKKGRKGKK